MKLYIEIDPLTGEHKNHPLLEENLKECGIDPETSKEYVPFERKSREEQHPGWPFAYAFSEYERTDEGYRDNHVFRELTIEEQEQHHSEQLAHGEQVKSTGRFTTWQYSREQGRWLPPQGVFPDEAILNGQRVSWNDQENRFDIE